VTSARSRKETLGSDFSPHDYDANSLPVAAAVKEAIAAIDAVLFGLLGR